MTEGRSTKLRYIMAASPDEIVLAVERLPFKVEIKGQPLQIKKDWILFFTIQDNIEFKSLNLT